MLSRTNLAWPDEAYSASRRPFGQKPLLLTALGIQWKAAGKTKFPNCVSVVYLRVARRDVLCLTEDTFSFGFRTYYADLPQDQLALIRLIDRESTISYSHALIIVAHGFADDLDTLRTAAGSIPTPGVTALERDWSNRSAVPKGRPKLFDTRDDIKHGRLGIEALCRRSRVVLDSVVSDQVSYPHAGAQSQKALAAEEPAYTNVRRTLAIALVAAEALEKYRWEEPIVPDRLIHSNAWDCFEQAVDIQST